MTTESTGDGMMIGPPAKYQAKSNPEKRKNPEKAQEQAKAAAIEKAIGPGRYKTTINLIQPKRLEHYQIDITEGGLQAGPLLGTGAGYIKMIVSLYQNDSCQRFWTMTPAVLLGAAIGPDHRGESQGIGQGMRFTGVYPSNSGDRQRRVNMARENDRPVLGVLARSTAIFSKGDKSMKGKTTTTKAGGVMVGDLELNLSDDKRVMVNAKGDGDGAIEIEFDNGDIGLRIRLSKKQAVELSKQLAAAKR